MAITLFDTHTRECFAIFCEPISSHQLVFLGIKKSLCLICLLLSKVTIHGDLAFNLFSTNHRLIVRVVTYGMVSLKILKEDANGSFFVTFIIRMSIFAVVFSRSYEFSTKFFPPSAFWTIPSEQLIKDAFRIFRLSSEQLSLCSICFT